VGFTDSIPLIALLLKPLSSVLPSQFQYLGPWLLLCFTLQGVFGVLISRLWTSSVSLQLTAALLFVLTPTLLNRVAHPALCAHWLLLWVLWLYLQGERGAAQSPAGQGLLGLVAGLIHPYLAAMVLASVVALAIKDLLGGAALRSGVGFFACLIGVLGGWGASGLFTISGSLTTANVAVEDLGYFSMNVLSPVTPSGWSTLLPDLPVGAPGQTFEGFQYLGAGTLLVIVAAILLAIARRRALPWRRLSPLVLVLIGCALYALSPRVTLGSSVLTDLTSPTLKGHALFRVTGRFFWPMAYLILTSAIAIVMTRSSRRFALTLLLSAVTLQLVDLNGRHTEWRTAARSEAFHGHHQILQSPVWPIGLPHYRHMVLYFPQQCGPAPASFEWPAHLAATYGLTINAGDVARYDASKRDAYCRALEGFGDHDVADDTIYLIHPDLVQRFRSRVSIPLTCTVLDHIPVCITEKSFQAWRSKAP